jgi:hypothetical protein
MKRSPQPPQPDTAFLADMAAAASWSVETAYDGIWKGLVQSKRLNPLEGVREFRRQLDALGAVLAEACSRLEKDLLEPLPADGEELVPNETTLAAMRENDAR